jgi:type I restriction enzyme S subunit
VVNDVLQQQLPVGYKQTGIGVIPEDWKVHTLNTQLSEKPRYGIGAAAVPLTGKLPVYLRITDISEDGCFKPFKKVGVDRVDAEDYVLQSGDLVFARTGASVGKSYLYRESDGKLVYAGFLIKISPNPTKLVPSFLFQYVKTRPYWNFVQVMSMRSGQPGINGAEYGQLLVPLPAPKEQTAIANALSDVDALITSLEKLIAKKRAIKTAAMQQLLTGKKRLPPFDKTHTGYKQTEQGEIPEEWEVVELSEAAEFHDGVRKPVKSGDRAKMRGIYRYYGASGVVDYVNDFLFDGVYILLGEDGENILSRNLPLVFKVEGKFWVNNHAHVMQPKKGFDIDYLTAFLESLDYSLLNSGTAQPKLNKQSCLTIKVAKPGIYEQNAIANTLTDMDKEIDALEQRLNKTKQLKQGMMQELLTGRTRLV